jgi:hypothetical protein
MAHREAARQARPLFRSSSNLSYDAERDDALLACLVYAQIALTEALRSVKLAPVRLGY